MIGITDAFRATSVRIGDLIVPGKSVERVLQKYCKHPFIQSGDPKFPYQFFGSGVGIKVEGRHFVFCCGHQIDQFNPETVTIRSAPTDVTISGSRLIKPTLTDENRDADWVDVRAIEYEVDRYGIANLSQEFFAINGNNIWPSSDAGIFILYGYPTERQDINYEIPHITARATTVKGRYDGASASPHVHRIKMDRKTIFDADGMSGGAVFYLGENTDGYFIGFAGMIMRGGARSDYIHFIEAGFLSLIGQS
jgi:hypothetical protein